MLHATEALRTFPVTCNISIQGKKHTYSFRHDELTAAAFMFV